MRRYCERRSASSVRPAALWAASISAVRSQRSPVRVLPERPLAGGLVLAGADRRPAGGVAVAWEAVHVGAELGQDHLGGALRDARDRAEQLTL
jgi:hypothetical protein